MDFWADVDAREEQRKQAARSYRESLKTQQDQLKQMKKQRESYGKSQEDINSSSGESKNNNKPHQQQQQNISNNDPSNYGQAQVDGRRKISLPTLPLQSNQQTVHTFEAAHSLGHYGNDQPHTSVNYPSTADINYSSEIRLLKDQLVSERQRSNQIETEVRKQQSLITSLQTQVEQQRFAISENNNTRFLNQKYEQQLAILVDQQFQAKSKSDALEQRFQQMSNEIATREVFAEQARKDNADKVKILLDELAGIKYKYEQMSLESVQADQELFHRTRELETHAVQDTTVKQLVKNHDVKLVAIERDLTTFRDTYEAAVAKLRNDSQQQFEYAEKNRQHLETNVLKQCADIKNVVELNSRETSTKLATLKEKIVSGFENELAALNSQIRELTIQMRRIEADGNSKLNSQITTINTQITSIHASIKDESAARKQTDCAVRADFNTRIKQTEFDLQNIKELSEAYAGNVKIEIATVLQKSTEQVQNFESIANDRLRVIEERAAMETRRSNEAAEGLRIWAEGYVVRVGADISRNIDSKLTTLEHSYQTLSKKVENIDFEKTIKLLKEQDMGSLTKNIDALKARLSSVEAITTSRFDDYLARENELRTKLDELSLRSASSADVTKLSETVNANAANLERQLEKLNQVENGLAESNVKTESILRDSHRISRELDSRPTINLMKDELGHFDTLIKNTESGLRKTWKAIEMLRGDTDNQSNITLVTDILSELQVTGEKLGNFDRQLKQIEAQVLDITGKLMDDANPKIIDLENQFHVLKHRVHEEIEHKLTNLDNGLNTHKTSTAKECQGIKDKFKLDLDKLAKMNHARFSDVENLVQNVQESIIKTEGTLRKNQDRYSHSYSEALESQLQTITKWKEQIQDEVDRLRNLFNADISRNDNQAVDVQAVAEYYQQRVDEPQISDDDDEKYAEKISKVLQDADRVLAEQQLDFSSLNEQEYTIEPAPLAVETKKEEAKKSILKSLNASMNSGVDNSNDDSGKAVDAISVQNFSLQKSTDAILTQEVTVEESEQHEQPQENSEDAVETKRSESKGSKGILSSLRNLGSRGSRKDISPAAITGSYSVVSGSRAAITSEPDNNVDNNETTKGEVKKSSTSIRQQPLFGPDSTEDQSDVTQESATESEQLPSHEAELPEQQQQESESELQEQTAPEQTAT